MSKLASSSLSPLGKRIFLVLFLMSIGASLAISAALLWLDYQSGVKRYEEVIEQISNSYQSSISYSLWNFDHRQLEAQLQGITNFPGIIYAQVDKDGKVIKSKGDLHKKAHRRLVIPLSYSNNETSYSLGQLRINQNYDDLYESLYSRGAAILLSNILLFIFLAFIVLLVVHYFVTKRLWQMAQWAKDFNLSKIDEELILDQGSLSEDEFSYLVDAINQMRLTIQDELILREKAHTQREQIQEQFSLAVDNAALGFCRYEVNTQKVTFNTHFASQLGTNEVDLEDMPDPMAFLINQISGPHAEEQVAEIERLLKGNRVRLHDRYTMKQQHHVVTLEISFQVISYHENLPLQVLICITDRTQETKLQNKVQQLNEELERDKEGLTSILMSENNKLLDANKEYRKENLKLRLGQQPRHLKALSLLMDEYLESWREAIAPGEYELWNEFLHLDFYKRLTTLDISQMIGNLTTVIAQKHALMISKDLPFSVVADEDPKVLSFTVEKLLFDELLERSSELSVKVRLDRGRLNSWWNLRTDVNEEFLTRSLSYKLADIVVRIRYSGSLSCKKEGEMLTIHLSTPFRT